MRRWLFTLSMLLLSAPLAFGQQQYTEAACILLQQQIERFSHQPQSSTYQDSKRQFANHCKNPLPAPSGDAVLTNIPNKPVKLESKTIVVPSQQASSITTPQPATTQTTPATVKPADVMNELLGATLQMFGALLKAFSMPLLMLFGFFIGGAVLGLIFKINGPRIKGALAERQLRRILQRELPAGYQHYANLVLPTAQGDLTEIDHLVLSPFGIFVIEVKNYQGWIFGSEHQPQWTVQHFKSKHSFQNPLHQNNKHIGAVKFALGLSLHDSKLVKSIVAFSERAEFRTPLPVQVCHIRQVAAYIQQFSQPWFSDEQLRQFTGRLNIAATNKKALSKRHMQQFEV